MFNSWLSKEKKMEGKKAKGLQHVPISLVKKKKKVPLWPNLSCHYDPTSKVAKTNQGHVHGETLSPQPWLGSAWAPEHVLRK